MRHRLIAFVTILITAGAIFSSCNQSGVKHGKTHWFKEYTVFNKDDYENFIKEKLSNDTDSSLLHKIERLFYFDRDFKPFWTEEGLQEKKVEELLDFFENATKHGISPNFFDFDLITANIDSLKKGKVPDNTALYAYLFDLEFTFTSNYVKYASAMAFGATDPKVVHGGKWYYETLQPDSAFIAELLDNISDFADNLKKEQPSSDEYKALQSELDQFYRWKNDSATVDAYKNIVPDGDVPDSATAYKMTHPNEHIKKISANLERLRWKFKHNKSDDTVCIVVNIPDYQYFVYQKDSLVINRKVCCGRTQDPKGHPERIKDGLILPFKSETPLMFSYINSLTLNPEWNIPYDIIKNEYYPKLVKSSTACIQREHIYIKDSRTGEYVHPETIDWSKVPRSNIPYRLHQTSGSYNALGRVKFVFANSESVYLHDTNNKGAFSRRRRALSHGCVRVEQPLELAEWVYKVNEFDTNYIERIHIIMGNEPTTEKGEKYLEEREEKETEYYENLSEYNRQFYRKLRPTSISLKKRIPLFIEYRTCYLDRNGEVQYRDDVYYKDDNIFRTLNPGSDF